jgi:hypothetical protein
MAKHAFCLPGSGTPLPDYIDSLPDPNARHPVEHIEPEDDDEEPDMSELGKLNPEGVQALLRWLIPTDDLLAPNMRDHRWRVAVRRLAALAHAVMPEIRGISQTELAKELGVTRAAISKLEVALRDWAGLSCNGGKSEAARESFRIRQRECWHDGRRKRKAEAAEG